MTETASAAAPREHFVPKSHAPQSEPARESRPAAQAQPAAPSPQREQQPQQPRSLLDKIRGMMRRNRRGNGMSGSFPFLIKALKTTEAGLLEQLAALGLVLQNESDPKPAFHEEGDFLYWMNKNQRGEIWINARKERRQNAGGPAMAHEGADGQEEGGMENYSEAPAVATEASSQAPTAEASATPVESAPVALCARRFGSG